jgi:hypothetical protein
MSFQNTFLISFVALAVLLACGDSIRHLTSADKRQGSGNSSILPVKSANASTASSVDAEQLGFITIGGFYNPKSKINALIGEQSGAITITVTKVDEASDSSILYNAVATIIPDNNNYFEVKAPSGKDIIFTANLSGKNPLTAVVLRGLSAETKLVQTRIEIDENSTITTELFREIVASPEGRIIWRKNQLSLSLLSDYAAAANVQLSKVSLDGDTIEIMKIRTVQNAFKSMVAEFISTVSRAKANVAPTTEIETAKAGKVEPWDPVANSNVEEDSALTLKARNLELTTTTSAIIQGFAEKIQGISEPLTLSAAGNSSTSIANNETSVSTLVEPEQVTIPADSDPAEIIASPLVLATPSPAPGEVATSEEARAKSGCIVHQETCRNHPESVGTFTDSRSDSQTNEEICLARAAQIHQRCGNGPTDITRTEYYIEGRLFSQKDTSTACFIEGTVCKSHPEAVGIFIDNDANTATNKEQCLRRAAQYSRWCNNQSSDRITATYVADGAVIDSRTTAQGCVIQQQTCAWYEQLVGSFVAYADNADIDSARCLAQAEQVSTWCKNTAGQLTYATFYDKSGAVVASTSYSPTSEAPSHTEAVTAPLISTQAKDEKAAAEKKAAADKAATKK